MAELTLARLLSTWESGVQRHPIDRSLLLLALARPDLPGETLADISLGVRNASLLPLQQKYFNKRFNAWLDCPACSERMEFELDGSQLPPVVTETAEPINIDGLRFRLPTTRDLARLIGQTNDANTAAQSLLQHCAESPDDLPTDNHALAELLNAVGHAIENIEPWADISLAIDCPACDTQCEANFDLASYVWDQLEHRARHLLDDIHVLAQAYSWSQSDILALSDARRCAFLARVQA
jgi:hypothetical protein